MFKEKYISMNEQISPDKELVNKIIHSIDETKRETIKSKTFFRRPIIILAMFLVIVLTVSPVLAVNVPAVYKLMYLVSPKVARLFVPVQKSCEDNGVRMEVVSVKIGGNTAQIYITMQDLIGDRVDETTDLFDSYSINRPFDGSATCERVGYDKATKTATFLISVTEYGNKKIIGDKISFTVREFLSGKRVYSDIPIAIDWRNVNNTPLTRMVSINGGCGSIVKELKEPNYENKVKVLVSSKKTCFPVEGIEFRGIGYVDGMLHIQTSVMKNLTKDNHGYFFLTDKKGNKIESDYSVSFVENPNTNNRIDYTEYVFKIPQSEIGKYSLFGTFITNRMLTQGNWKVTFPLEETKNN